MFQLVLKIYELRHQGNGYMLPEIKRFLEKKKYNEVRTKVPVAKKFDNVVSFTCTDYEHKILMNFLMNTKVTSIKL